MALQTSIQEYFISKKRQGDELESSAKVLVLENEDADNATDDKQVIYKESPKCPAPKVRPASAPRLQRKTPKVAARRLSSARKERSRSTDDKQTDIRRALLPSFQESLEEEMEAERRDATPIAGPSKVQRVVSFNDEVETIAPQLPTKEQESYSEIKSKILKSSRLEKLKKALDKVNQGRQKLDEIQKRKELLSPEFKKFDKITIEVPVSPAKNFMDEKPGGSPSVLRTAVFKSPSKFAPGKMPYISPRKLFESPPRKTTPSPVSSPTFQRYYNLASAGKPTLVLPYKYRCLAEIFRSVDTVVSILFNRRETIYFEKLKASVQQMSRKNLTETLLGQIKNVFPDSYSFRREKRRTFANTPERYELVITPIIAAGENMGPSALLERRREFFRSLMEMTMDHHELFMRTLDPPLTIPKHKLTRWHPEFNVDNCPDVPPASLPLPPGDEKLSTAKDVLMKARELIGGNTRMEKALERLSEKKDKQALTPASQAIPGLTNALKGIPKSLLEKVRARQAAKAAELITRPPEETQRRMELTRLPEMARILRNLFVFERKSIISKYSVMEKIKASHHDRLTDDQLNKHLNLLSESVPGWLSLYEVEGEPYVKLAKDAEMSKVMSRLQELIAQNQIHA